MGGVGGLTWVWIHPFSVESAFVTPVMDWWPVQGVPCFLPYGSWDNLQHPCDPWLDKWKRMNGWMGVSVILCVWPKSNWGKLWLCLKPKTSSDLSIFQMKSSYYPTVNLLKLSCFYLWFSYNNNRSPFPSAEVLIDTNSMNEWACDMCETAQGWLNRALSSH